MDATVLESVAVKILTKTGKTWSTQIPVDMLEEVVDFSGFDYIQIEE